MKKGIILGLLLLPTVSLAQTLSATPTVEWLMAQIKMLEQTIATLQSGGAVGELRFERILRRGMSGDDVRNLQKALAQDPTVYPEKLLTGYFGALTEAAVQRFQRKVAIVSEGTPTTTGYGQVGPRTVTKLNELATYGSGSSTSSVGTTSNTVAPTRTTSTSTTQSTQSSTGGGSSTSSNPPDYISPTVSITAPLSSTIVSGSTTVTANVWDNVGISSVKFKLDGVEIGTDTSSPYSISWATNSASSGNHVLSAVVQDLAGNTNVSSEVIVFVSNTN